MLKSAKLNAARKFIAPASMMLAAAALSACTSEASRPIAAAPPPPPMPVAKPAPPPAPVLVLQDPDNSVVWALRSGLNVAALTCSGGTRVAVAPAYRQLLKNHEGLLATAYKSQVGIYGVRNFDREQTKVYNRFSQQKSPEEFCKTAARIANEANGMNSASLFPKAPELLARLELGLKGNVTLASGR